MEVHEIGLFTRLGELESLLEVVEGIQEDLQGGDDTRGKNVKDRQQRKVSMSVT